MLSLLPSLLTYDLAAPLLLRLTLGIVFAFWAYRKLYRMSHGKNNKTLTIGIIEAIVGILLIVGFFTQLAALAAIIILVIRLGYAIKNKAFLTDGVNYHLILLVIAISLLFTGPGFLAFDLPL